MTRHTGVGLNSNLSLIHNCRGLAGCRVRAAEGTAQISLMVRSEGQYSVVPGEDT